LGLDISKKQKKLNTAAELEATLVPAYILIPLWLIALTLPNLIYSGTRWYETLHLTKWLVCGASVALAGLVAGCRLTYLGNKRLAFKTDGFAVLWIVLFVYLMIQPLWGNIKSISSFVQESFCFVAVIGFYIMSLNSFPLKIVRPLIWLANINGAINVLFAEIQTRYWVEGVYVGSSWWEKYFDTMEKCSETIWNWLQSIFPTLGDFTGNWLQIILPTPGNYIGNTGQQNMFGLWLAICVMNSIYLFVAYATLPSGKKRPWPVTLLNILFLFINCYGLWASTSRSAMLSLMVGLIILTVMFLRLKADMAFIKRMFAVTVIFIIAVIASYMYSPERFGINIGKTLDIIQNAETIGGRSGIWATSRAMFTMYPSGVGLGQYKWHYLEAQRRMFDNYPNAEWQYTHWAHNEFLQWFCEAGVIGGTIMVLMLLWWFISIVAAFKKRKEVSSEAIWANALIGLLLFNAFWTRPFHRIENILWMSLAFAIANREMLFQIPRISIFEVRKFFMRFVIGVLFAAISIAGILYLSSGMYGDRQIRLALSTNDAMAQRALLMTAQKHMMVKLEAEKQLAYHYISYAEAVKNENVLMDGLQRLMEYFKKEPHTQELNVLLNWGQRLQNMEVLEYLTGYFKPGSFTIRQVPAEVPPQEISK